MAFEQPQSRNEAILQNMLGAENELVPPQSRIEALLQAILLQGVPDGAVTTDKLADGAVTYDKLAEALKNLIDGKADKEGNWELIDTITVSDSNISLVLKNVDGNGNALALKNIAFYIYLPSDGRTSASTLACVIFSNNTWCGRLYRQGIIGKTETGVYWENKIENGFWNNKYEITQGITALLAKTYLSESATNSDALNSRAETNSPYCRAYRIGTSGDPLPIGTQIKVYGIK